MKIDCYLTSDVRSFPVLESSQYNMMGANFLSSIVNTEQKNCKTKSNIISLPLTQQLHLTVGHLKINNMNF